MSPGYETARAWQHLANAGLIEGSYSGVGDTFMTPGVNTPLTKYPNGVWVVWYVPYYMSWNPRFGVHYFSFGLAPQWDNESLTPGELWNIDTKIDDGMPFTGIVNDEASPSYSPNCEDNQYAPTDPSPHPTANYNLSFTGPHGCIPMFVASF